jgi:hypothetical protein
MQVRAKTRRRFDPNNLSVRDVLLIAPIVLALSAVGIAFAFLVSDEVYIKWGGLAVNTAVVLGFVIYHSREFLRKQRFWILVCAALTVHLTLWIIFLSHVDEWKLAWFGLMALEVPVFFYLRSWPES